MELGKKYWVKRNGAKWHWVKWQVGSDGIGLYENGKKGIR